MAILQLNRCMYSRFKWAKCFEFAGPQTPPTPTPSQPPSSCVIFFPSLLCTNVYKSSSRRGPCMRQNVRDGSLAFDPPLLCWNVITPQQPKKKKKITIQQKWRAPSLVTKKKMKHNVKEGKKSKSTTILFHYPTKRARRKNLVINNKGDLEHLDLRKASMEAVGRGSVGATAQSKLFFFFSFLLFLLVILTVALEQLVQVLLQGVRLQGIWGVIQTLQVHVLPQGIPHHGPLLGAWFTHLTSARRNQKEEH